jgi:hypothetical protein
MRRIMAMLRRVLYWEAAIWGLLGAAAALAPGFFLETVLNQAPYPSYALVRVVGAQAIGTALLAILIGQHVDDHWWWSWAIAFVAAASTTIFAVTAVVGVPAASAAWPWWALTVLAAASAAGILVGVAVAGAERPIT